MSFFSGHHRIAKTIAWFLLSVASSHARSQDYKIVYTLTDNDGAVSQLARHPDGSMVINGDITGKLYFRDAASGQVRRKIQAHSGPVSLLSFNSNGRLMISGSSDGELKIFDFDKDAIAQSIYSPDYAGMRFALFSIADGFIYFNSGGRIFKTRSDLTQQVKLILQEQDTVTDAVISADRGSLVYAAGTMLKVMDTRTDVLHQEINAGGSALQYIRWLNDSVLATWAGDGTLSFWKFQSGQLITPAFLWMKAGMPGPFAFNSDGTRMVSGNVGNWARIWEPANKEVIQELFGHKSTVVSAVYGSSDAWIFTGSKDGTIRMWRSATIKDVSAVKPPQQEPVIAPVTSTTPISEPVIEPVKDPGSATAVTTPDNPAASTVQGSDSLNAVKDTASPVTSEPVVQAPQKDSVPEVKMEEDNKPSMIGGREVRQAGTIEVNTQEVTIYVFDNSYIDGDTMSLYFNDEWILDHYGVTKSKKPVKLTFNENTNNYLVLFANNLGKTPPNTAAIQFFDGKSERFFRLSSDLRTCSALNFIYRK